MTSLRSTTELVAKARALLAMRLATPLGEVAPFARLLDAVTLAVVGGLHQTFASSFELAQVSLDERFFLWEGWALGRGMVPYRDFQEFKPPVIFVVNMLALKIFGFADLHYRLFFSLLSLAAFLTLATALLTRGVARLLVVAALVFFLAAFFNHSLHDSSINDAESPAVTFFVMATGVLLAKTRFVRTQHVVGAVLFALVPLTKEPMALAVIPAWVCFLLLYRLEATEANAARRFVARTLGAVLSVVAIWLAYMLMTGSLGWYFVQLRESFAYSRDFAYLDGRARHLAPWPAFSDSAWQLGHNFPHPQRLAALLPLCFAALTFDRKWRGAAIAAALSVAASLFAVTIGHCFWKHYYLMVVPTAILLAALGCVLLDAVVRPKKRWRLAVSLVGAIAAVVAHGGRLIDDHIAAETRRPHVPGVSMDVVQTVWDHSGPDDTIWALGDPLLYVVTNRKNAVREGDVIDPLINLRPGATDEERLEGERQELDRAPPKLIVFNDAPFQGYDIKQRFLTSLVKPFLDSHHYLQIGELVYERPD